MNTESFIQKEQRLKWVFRVFFALLVVIYLVLVGLASALIGVISLLFVVVWVLAWWLYERAQRRNARELLGRLESAPQTHHLFAHVHEEVHRTQDVLNLMLSADQLVRLRRQSILRRGGIIIIVALILTGIWPQTGGLWISLMVMWWIVHLIGYGRLRQRHRTLYDRSSTPPLSTLSSSHAPKHDQPKPSKPPKPPKPPKSKPLASTSSLKATLPSIAKNTRHFWFLGAMRGLFWMVSIGVLWYGWLYRGDLIPVVWVWVAILLIYGMAYRHARDHQYQPHIYRPSGWIILITGVGWVSGWAMQEIPSVSVLIFAVVLWIVLVLRYAIAYRAYILHR